jgi:hypothetical protein
MNAMGHEIPNPLGVSQADLSQKVASLLPGYMSMGEFGMAEHQDHGTHMKGPKNTLPMMMGTGPFGNLEMGGMFTVVKIRDEQPAGDYRDPGWYKNPEGTVAYRVGGPASAPAIDHGKMDHSQMDHGQRN